MYTNRGWNGDQIQVTGIPRYDRISRIKNEKKIHSRKILKLLFQATHIWPSSPDLRGYLGCHITNTGDFQAPAFRLLMEALRDLPIEVIVKPHDVESMIPWTHFVNKTKGKNKITIVSHSADFLKLLSENDGMISGCWSTTLIEAALMSKPSFYVVGRPVPNTELDHFAKNGFCQIFDDSNDLNAAFKKLCELGSLGYFQSIAKIKKDFYLGYQDGQSTTRVTNYILQNIATSKKPRT